jgi:putative PIN family toxin of toxin-antitoxin system
MPKSNFVLDTNIWLSLIITQKLNDVLVILKAKTIQVFVSEELLDEIEEVLNRPKLSKYIFEPPEYYIELINRHTINHATQKYYHESPDDDDNYLYDLCMGTKSTLVTGDKLLLAHKSEPLVDTITFDIFKKSIK